MPSFASVLRRRAPFALRALDFARRVAAPRPPAPWTVFARGFLKNPGMVSSVVPSSPLLVRRLLAPVDWASCRLFVEYGPGVGTFTRPVLDRLPADARLIAIDTNADFVRYLRHAIRDPRLSAVEGSAADVARIVAEAGFGQADYVLSGIPFSVLPEEVGPAIIAATADVLRPGGAFLVYQVSTRVRALLGDHWGRIDHAMEWRNVPPEQLYWAWK